jgi:hypothetical protein
MVRSDGEKKESPSISARNYWDFFQTAQFVLKHEHIFRMPKTFGQK